MRIRTDAGLVLHDISRAAGLFSGKRMNDAIALGFLDQMEEHGRVEQKKQSNDRNGWALTKAEYVRRNDDGVTG